MTSGAARHAGSPGGRRGRIIVAGVAVLVLALGAGLAVGLTGSSPARRGGAGKGKVHPVAQDSTAGQTAVFSGPNGVEAEWVIKENEQPGTSAWHITTTQTPDAIMGYANHVYAQLGQQVTLYVSTVAPSFHVDAYRMGYYQGLGAHLVWRSGELPGKVQATCPVTPGINMVQCSWTPSLTFTVTKAWVQGDYLLKLVGSGNQQSYVPITIWDPSSHATYVIQNSVLTWQAWNPFGGYDLYGGAPPGQTPTYAGRSRVLSFDRPYATSYANGAADFLGNEFPFVYWAEEHGLNVTYWTDITLSRHPQLLQNHQALITLGHDEEWSLHMREGAVAAAQHGVNLVFLGASPILRKVRLQASPLGPDRQEVDYRDPQADPLYGKDNAEVSQNQWAQPPANLPASTLVGESYGGYGIDAPLVVSDASSWIYAGTGLHNGSQLPGVIRYDFDTFVPTRPDPPDVQILAHSPVTPQAAVYGAPSYADTTYYTMASSGAGVFSSGTNYWVYSMSPCPAGATPASCPAPALDRITGNLLAVFGQGPAGRTHPSVTNWRQFYP